MAYRLKAGHSAGKQLARIVRKEFEHAVGEMGDAEGRTEAVHDVRKRVKKIRAVLRLLRSPLGRDYRIHSRRLRTVAHRLSALRDADAAIEVMASVRRHYPALVTRTMFDAVRRGLTPRERGAVSRLRPTQIRRELRRSVAAVSRSVRRAADAAAIDAGLARGYSRARQALRCVKRAPEDLGFHAWRRRVKDHWYHLRLVEAVHPAARARVRLLQRLEKWLGDDHNLVLLRATLLEAPSRFGDEHATAIVLGCLEKYEATLRKRALKLGERLFAPKPRVFVRSLQRRGRR
jgi:CHAD domain-containing protein